MHATISTGRSLSRKLTRTARNVAIARAAPAVPRIVATTVAALLALAAVSGCAGTATPHGDAVAKRVGETTGPDTTVEVALGARRFSIPREYLRYRSVPTTARSIELVLHWPELGPGLYPPPDEPLAAAAEIPITVLSAEQMPAATLVVWRGQYLKRKPGGGMADPQGRARGEPLHGLTPYYAPRAQRPEDDWFLANPTPQGAGSVIECTSRMLDDGVAIADGRLIRGPGDSDVLASCRHSFEVSRHGAIVHADYPRVLLGHWKRIEAAVGLLLDGHR